jgi:hypothetical protein
MSRMPKEFISPSNCTFRAPPPADALKRTSCLPFQSSVQSFRANVGGDGTRDIFRNWKAFEAG